MISARIPVLAGLLWLFATAAFSQGAGVKDGWYVGVDLGQSDFESESSFIGAVERDDSSSSWSLRAGYRFSRFFSLEGGYTDIGDFSAVIDIDCPSCVPIDASISIDGFFVHAVGTWPIARHFHLKGLVGITHRQMDNVWTSSQDTMSWSDSANITTLAAGIAVPINDRFEVGLDYTHYREIGLGLTLGSELGAFDEAEASVLSLGLRFRF